MAYVDPKIDWNEQYEPSPEDMNRIEKNTKQNHDDIESEESARISADDTLEGNKAEKSTNISAGTGLNGGGDLSSNRTINMNSSQLMTTSNVLSRVAGASAGAVGTYGMLGTLEMDDYPNELNPGDTAAGSDLRWMGYEEGSGTRISDSPSGTWRCMGYLDHYSNMLTLFLRIS